MAEIEKNVVTVIAKFDDEGMALLRRIADALDPPKDSSFADEPRRLVEAQPEVNADIIAKALKNGTVSELGQPNHQ